MSYRLRPPGPRLAMMLHPTATHPSAQTQPQQVYPLSLADVQAIDQVDRQERIRKWVIGLLALAALAFAVWWFMKRRPRRNPGGKLMTRKDALGRASTQDLAKKLYERLDSQGANASTLRAVKRIADKE